MTLRSRFNLLPVLVCTAGLMSACATTTGSSHSDVPVTRSAPATVQPAIPPAETDADQGKVALARQFLHSWNAGGLALTAMRQQMESSDDKSSPGMAELNRRVVASITADDFENLAARIYARHLDQADLEALARFAESSAGNRYLRIAIASAMEHQPTEQSSNAILKQFNADELTQILKFLQSDAFHAMSAALPAINSEMSQAGRQLGRDKMREYLKQH